MNETSFPFVNKTTYDRAALIALNRMAERSVRKEKSYRTRLLCYTLGGIGLVGGAFCYPKQALVGSLLLLYGVLLLLVGVNWNTFQLRSSQRQLQHGIQTCTYEFDETEFLCNTGAGVIRYPYDSVFAVISDEHWYAIFFDTAHGVILKKDGFTTGDPLSFRAFIGQHTQLPIQDL